jgi:hypothetical protein
MTTRCIHLWALVSAAVFSLLALGGCVSTRCNYASLNPSFVRQWRSYVGGNLTPGDSESKVDQVLDGKYRDRGLVRVPIRKPDNVALLTKPYGVYYLLDDCHELRAYFNARRELDSVVLHSRGLWQRLPSDEVQVVDEAGDGAVLLMPETEGFSRP